MKGAPLCLAFALCALPPIPAGPAWLSLDSDYEYSDGLSLRCSLSDIESRLLLACRSSGPPAAAGEPVPPSFAVGFALPWLRMGPLSPSGLFRETANPLGYRPGSDVFHERTSLLLDGSFPLHGSGFLLLAPSGPFGLFCRPVGNDGLQLGCYSSLSPPDGLRAEFLVSLSEPCSAEASDRWLQSRAPYPGGMILEAATRLQYAMPSLSLSTTFGRSAAQKAPPGCFSHFHCEVELDGITASLLLGSAEKTYRTPWGAGSVNGLEIAGAVGIARPAGSADLRLCILVGQEGFSPRPLRESREEVDFTIERPLVRFTGGVISCLIEAGKTVNWDTEGRRLDAARCAIAANGQVGHYEAEARVNIEDPGGLGILLSHAITFGKPESRVSLQTGICRLGAGPPAVSAVFGARWERRDSAIDLEAGIGEYMPGTAEIVRNIRLKIGYSVRSTLPPRAPPFLDGSPVSSRPLPLPAR